jgi:hypothetical protein
MQPRGTFRQTSFTSNRSSISHPMPSISDEDIGLEFEKLNEPAPTKVVIIYVFLSYFDHRRGCHGRDCMVVGCSTTCAYHH